MPERYSSIGEAVGAAMAHNIRLVYGEPSGPSAPVPDPHSVTGMTGRLTETATLEDIAAVLAEVNTPLTGPLAQLTELIAAAADWARLRQTLDEPHRRPVSATWSKLAACHVQLRQMEQWLHEVQDVIPAIPGDLRDPRCADAFRTLRTRAPQGEPPTAQQHAARTASPHTAASADTAPSTPPTAPPPSPPGPSPRTR